MKFIAVLFAVIFQSNNGRSQQMDSAFMHLACQQCDTWCPAQQPRIPQGPPRVGKAGPRGLPGPKGEPGIVNLTEMELMMDRKIKEVLGLLATRGCRDFRPELAKTRKETGGSFDIFIPGVGLKEVYCDARTDGGSWIVFQRRMDGSVDFYRYWNDYVIGFGSTIGEFWLGLEAIHQLTASRNYELRIDMFERDGTYYYAKYSSFKVGPASDNYRLRVDGYSGNVTDSFGGGGHSLNNMAFSARDQDHDTWSSNCATKDKGGWWYRNCQWTNLNGLYARNSQGMRWYQQGQGQGSSDRYLYMKFTEMKLRLKQ